MSSWCVALLHGGKAFALMLHPSQWKLLLYHIVVWTCIMPVCLIIDMWLVPLRCCGLSSTSAQKIAFANAILTVAVVLLWWVTTTLSELLAFPDSVKFEITISGSLFYSLLNFTRCLAILILCFGSLILNGLSLFVFALKILLMYPFLMVAILSAAIVVLVIFKS